MIWTDKGLKVLELAGQRYKERIAEEVENKYRGTFRAINGEDVTDAIGRLMIRWGKCGKES